MFFVGAASRTTLSRWHEQRHKRGFVGYYRAVCCPWSAFFVFLFLLLFTQAGHAWKFNFFESSMAAYPATGYCGYGSYNYPDCDAACPRFGPGPEDYCWDHNNADCYGVQDLPQGCYCDNRAFGWNCEMSCESATWYPLDHDLAVQVSTESQCVFNDTHPATWACSTEGCLCYQGAKGTRCELECPRVWVNDSLASFVVCGGHPCDDTGTCVCPFGLAGPTCEDHCPGYDANAPELACSGHGYCRDGSSGNAVCVCVGGFKGDDCSIVATGTATASLIPIPETSTAEPTATLENTVSVSLAHTSTVEGTASRTFSATATQVRSSTMTMSNAATVTRSESLVISQTLSSTLLASTTVSQSQSFPLSTSVSLSGETLSPTISSTPPATLTASSLVTHTGSQTGTSSNVATVTPTLLATPSMALTSTASAVVSTTLSSSPPATPTTGRTNTAVLSASVSLPLTSTATSPTAEPTESRHASKSADATTTEAKSFSTTQGSPATPSATSTVTATFDAHRSATPTMIVETQLLVRVASNSLPSSVGRVAHLLVEHRGGPDDTISRNVTIECPSGVLCMTSPPPGLDGPGRQLAKNSYSVAGYQPAKQKHTLMLHLPPSTPSPVFIFHVSGIVDIVSYVAGKRITTTVVTTLSDWRLTAVAPSKFQPRFDRSLSVGSIVTVGTLRNRLAAAVYRAVEVLLVCGCYVLIRRSLG